MIPFKFIGLLEYGATKKIPLNDLKTINKKGGTLQQERKQKSI